MYSTFKGQVTHFELPLLHRYKSIEFLQVCLRQQSNNISFMQFQCTNKHENIHNFRKLYLQVVAK